ncbi:response regulator transcription factor [Paenibacillus aurantius]|uniref:Response regulator transcription factor n=1 Tax=Paenibacillus aurantius TaxID=2918900 RepID=A0AA96RJ67_9BACL|nr:response regulator transcription factor [Paenibacillus aurantius]WJH32492.1 response regulator transcription factor [Paenibacillus sp. CC-CFT747]WNQ12914.1 response regulator transcription factor [Paenibacillus aurantius]
MTKEIHIMLVDDHSLVRQGVRSFLETQSDLRIVGEAASGEEAEALAAERVPDVVLMDLSMPGIGGIEAIRRVKKSSPHSQIVVLTSFQEDEYIFPALRAGALSYVLKNVQSGDLADIIRKACVGEAFLHPRVAARVVQELREERKDIPNVFNDLTERELEVLRLIAQGNANAAIAQALGISEQTVKGHVSNILGKLQLADRTQAAVLAWEQGVVQRKRQDG